MIKLFQVHPPTVLKLASILYAKEYDFILEIPNAADLYRYIANTKLKLK